MPRKQAKIDVEQLAALLNAKKPKSAKKVAVGKEKAKTNPWLQYLREYRAGYKMATQKTDKEAIKDLSGYYKQGIAPPVGGSGLSLNVLGSGRKGLARR